MRTSPRTSIGTTQGTTPGRRRPITATVSTRPRARCFPVRVHRGSRITSEARRIAPASVMGSARIDAANGRPDSGERPVGAAGRVGQPTGAVEASWSPTKGLALWDAGPTGGVLPAGSAHLVNEVVRASAGGPQQYTGRLMGHVSPPRGSPRPSGRHSCRTCISSLSRFQVASKQAELDASRAWWPGPVSGRAPCRGLATGAHRSSPNAEVVMGQQQAGSVVGIWRYPVKSMMGEELNASEVTERGLLGDRAYAADGPLDRQGGQRQEPPEMAAAVRLPRRLRRGARAAVPSCPKSGSPCPTVRYSPASQADLDETLSRELQREVTLEEADPGRSRSPGPGSHSAGSRACPRGGVLARHGGPRLTGTLSPTSTCPSTRSSTWRWFTS